MADSQISKQLVELGMVKDFGEEPDDGDGLKNVVLHCNDSGPFLATVLESVESQVTEARGVRRRSGELAEELVFMRRKLAGTAGMEGAGRRRRSRRREGRSPYL